jgi:hypothetical protein
VTEQIAHLIHIIIHERTTLEDASVRILTQILARLQIDNATTFVWLGVDDNAIGVDTIARVGSCKNIPIITTRTLSPISRSATCSNTGHPKAMYAAAMK